jgi:hypothetical protein
MKKAFFLILLLSLSAPAHAQYAYDTQSGSAYYTGTDGNGGSSTWGYNQNTGSTWSSHTNSDGSSFGTSASGKMWYNDAPSPLGPSGGQLFRKYSSHSPY